MGFFKKRGPSTGGASAGTGVVLAADELERCSRLLRVQEEAQMRGDSDAVRSGARELARAAGVDWDTTDLLQGIQEQGKDPDAFKRPWRWLAAASSAASEGGNAVLTIRIGFFVSFWARNVAPNMTILDEQETGLSKAGLGEVTPEVVDRARAALEEFGDDDVIIAFDSQAITGRWLRAFFAEAGG